MELKKNFMVDEAIDLPLALSAPDTHTVTHRHTTHKHTDMSSQSHALACNIVTGKHTHIQTYTQ